jgi:hypothetical protein
LKLRGIASNLRTFFTKNPDELGVFGVNFARKKQLERRSFLKRILVEKIRIKRYFKHRFCNKKHLKIKLP